MTSLPLALTVAVMALFLGCCTAVLFRYRRGRLAADALHLLDRYQTTPPPPLLPFAPLGATVVGMPNQNLARLCGLTLAEAEDVLDWLEQNGFEERSLLCESGTSFSVEFRLDSGHIPTPAPHLTSMRRYTAG